MGGVWGGWGVVVVGGGGGAWGDAEAACLAPSADAGGHPPQPPSACRRYRWRDLLPGGTAASLIDNTKCSLQCIFAEAV